MRLILLVLLLVPLLGCKTPDFMVKDPAVRVARYLEQNPGRPDEIRQGLLAGEPCVGMTQPEVTLCWGKPRTVESSAQGVGRVDVWTFTTEPVREHAMPWDMVRKLGKVTFERQGEEMVAVSCIDYSKEPVREVKSDAEPWPALALTAVMLDNKKVRMALVNGQLLKAGSQIQGVTIRAIESKGILLQFKQQTLFLKTGTSTR